MGQRFARPLRSSDAPLFLESFLVAAVVSFLAIRGFLTLAGFPRIGAGQLHIAHMLWGGALMLVALLLLLAFLDRPIQHLAAIVAGLGFGTFIDEIGKFVTADNDYFFRPAIALIYIVFVVVFLTARTLEGQRRLSQQEALANALDLLEGTLEGPLGPAERARIGDLLDQASVHGELVDALRGYLETVPARSDARDFWETVPGRVARRYERLAGNPRFDALLSAAIIVYAAAAMVGSSVVMAQTNGAAAPDSLTVAAVGQAVSTLAGALLIGRGVIALRSSRAGAYRWFLRGLLVWLLITQVFIFYRSQLAGVGGLAIDLLAYVSLRYALGREVTGDAP